MISEAAVPTGTRDIVVEEVLPFTPAHIWRALTSGAMMARWLMEPSGFEPVVGNRFTFTTTPMGAWDGFIRCEVLEVVQEQRFVFSWKGGHESNDGYGSKLDTVVTWTLTPEGEGTRLMMVHSGFVPPKNDMAFTNMSKGWATCMDRLEAATQAS